MKNIGKIVSAVFIVLMFLTSSIMTVTAETRLKELEENFISGDSTSNPQLGFNQQQSQNPGPPQSPPKKYAVIMVGRYFGLWNYGHPQWNYDMIQQYYTWYLNDAGRLYTTLQDTYGYDNDSIFLLVRTLPEYFFEIPESFDPDWIDYISSEENLEAVLGTFEPGGENELTQNDQLFFCFIDHGGNKDENYYRNDHYVNEFISPNNHIGSNWVNEYKAYDTYSEAGHYVHHDTDTGTVFRKVQNEWSDRLVLSTDETKTIKGFRIFARKDDYFDQMNVTFYNNGNLVKSLTIDEWPNYKYKYVEFEGEEIQVNKVKIRFHENHPYRGFGTNWAVVTDFNFWESDSCGEVGTTSFGCQLQSIPDFLMWIFGNDVDNLYDYELYFNTKYIEGKIIYALQPCNSGGFISELSGENRIICTASRGFEFADCWIGPFRQALDRIDEDGDGTPDADLYPQDGNISILEAYRYAANYVEENFPGKQHPLIDDNSDHIRGTGHHFYETTYYDPNDPEKDGYLAANTFL